MAGADVIEAAIGITLLLIVSYVVLGGITTAANTVSSAKKDMTLRQEERLGTKINITKAIQSSPTAGVWFMIKNTGNTIIDNSTMNFIVLSDGSPTTMYFNTMGDGNSGTWNSDNIHYGENHDPVNDNCELINPNQWDPDEYLYVWIGFSQNPIGVWAITPNGATSYHSVP